MIVKKTARRIINHAWYFHLFNAFSAILSFVAFDATNRFRVFYEGFGTELPALTQFVVDNHLGLLVILALAVGLSVLAYVVRTQGKEIRSLKKASAALLLLTIVCCMGCLAVMSIPLMCQCKVIA